MFEGKMSPCFFADTVGVQFRFGLMKINYPQKIMNLFLNVIVKNIGSNLLAPATCQTFTIAFVHADISIFIGVDERSAQTCKNVGCSGY